MSGSREVSRCRRPEQGKSRRPQRRRSAERVLEGPCLRSAAKPYALRAASLEPEVKFLPNESSWLFPRRGHAGRSPRRSGIQAPLPGDEPGADDDVLPAVTAFRYATGIGANPARLRSQPARIIPPAGPVPGRYAEPCDILITGTGRQAAPRSGPVRGPGWFPPDSGRSLPGASAARNPRGVHTGWCARARRARSGPPRPFTRGDEVEMNEKGKKTFRFLHFIICGDFIIIIAGG